MISFLASPLRNLLVGIAFVLTVMVLATVAYVWSGWTLGDAIYMVVLTVYTVGYDEVNPINTPALRAITVALIVTGCTGMIFLTGTLVQLFTVSQFQQLFGSRRMLKDLDRLSGHVIICGYGRIGQMLARELKAGRCDFVVLERSEARIAAVRELGFLGLQGDATDEEVLKVGRRVARPRARHRPAGRCRQRLHHPERAQPQPRPVDHRPGRGGLDREQAAAGGRRPGRAADAHRRRANGRAAALPGP